LALPGRAGGRLAADAANFFGHGFPPRMGFRVLGIISAMVRDHLRIGSMASDGGQREIVDRLTGSATGHGSAPDRVGGRLATRGELYGLGPGSGKQCHRDHRGGNQLVSRRRHDSIIGNQRADVKRFL
jgi:hypothetical protein